MLHDVWKRVFKYPRFGITRKCDPPSPKLAHSLLWLVTLLLGVLSYGEVMANTITTPLRTFQGHTSSVMSVAFAPDGNSILSGSGDGTLKLWNTNTGEIIRTFQGHTVNVYSVAFAPDGNTALSGSNDNTLKLWNVKTGEVIRTFQGHKY